MYYTVIHKSGFRSSKYKIFDTFTNSDEAYIVAGEKECNEVGSSWFDVCVIKHRKPVYDYMKNDTDSFVTFSGNVKAFF